ncbi:MAG: histidine--tRNA ligase family protein, partial [Proteobacteria bacterium]|nr:histidine--tRNA ligase family protein [Pseudomonadota bacterium]
PAYDAEVPVVIADVFRELQIGAFTIEVSNRKILKGCMDSIGIKSAEDKATVLREIDKADKIGWAEVYKNLIAKIGSSGAQLEGLIKYIEEIHGNEERIKKWPKMYLSSGETVEGLKEIELLLSMTTDMGAGDVIRFNPAITRGLDYYTGTVYETFLNEHKNFGSICSGGRYDNLASHYTKSKLPGVGISIGATRLFEQMRQAGMVKESASSVQVLICFMDKALEADTRKIATTLRQAGIRTALYLEEAKLEKQIKYADRSGIPYVLIMGEDEKKREVAALRNLKTREQKDIPLANLGAEVKKLF